MAFDIGFDFDDALDLVGLSRKSKGINVGMFIAGIGLGAVVGAGVTALLWPYTGPQTRQRLAQAGDDLRHQVSDKLRQVSVKADRASAQIASADNPPMGGL